MFCRFGSLELSRPVAATTWLNEAWTRPSRVDQRRQGVEVGALELGELAVLDQEPGQRVLGGQLLQDLRVGARLAAGGLLERGQLQLVEQDLAELRAGADVELAPGQRVDLRLDRRQPLGELLREPAEERRRRPGCRPPPSRRARRSAAARARRRGPRALPRGPSGRGSPRAARRVGVLAGVVGHLGHVDLVHRELVLPLADQVGDRDHRVVEQPPRRARRGCGSARRSRAGSSGPSCRSPARRSPARPGRARACRT